MTTHPTDPAREDTQQATPATQPHPPTPGRPRTGRIVHGSVTVALLLILAGLLLRQLPGMVPVVDALGSLAGGVGSLTITTLAALDYLRRR
ncbi:hypothetical protein [Streptomyces sp. NPDC058667]|uniref:hypothetical protein n=1 Tax=Streptomyces sp. NPDC058667 TaxID=3346588 RepID=UPI0036491661